MDELNGLYGKDQQKKICLDNFKDLLFKERMIKKTASLLWEERQRIIFAALRLGVKREELEEIKNQVEMLDLKLGEIKRRRKNDKEKGIA